MTLYQALLTSGYFPKELPPTFHTESYGAWAAKLPSGASSIPAQSTVTRPCAHNLAQAGTLRRRLGIPNPIAAHHASRVIDTHWNTLGTHLQQSRIAKSTPAPGLQRALVPAIPQGGLPEARAQTRALGRYLLSADVSRCYGSIYTHSTPWALHTKQWAKSNQAGGCGNELDLVVRNGQDRQTLGIPIGPDSSFVIAECVLTAVDGILDKNCGPVRGHRFMDDYEIAFASYDQAQHAMGVLQEAPGEFELALNPAKTQIVELPCEHEPAWVAELRAFVFRDTPRAQASDFLRYFDRCYQLARENSNAHVLQYGVARLASLKPFSINFGLFQSLLLQASLAEPKTFRPFLQLLLALQTQGFAIDRANLDRAVELQITRHAPLGHASEVAWSLWAALAFSLQVTPKAAAELGRMDDSIVALLALHCAATGRITSGLDTALWESTLTADELRRSRWLLSYEASLKGWLPVQQDHIKQDAFFSSLRQDGVSFYDPARLTIVSVTGEASGGGTAGAYE